MPRRLLILSANYIGGQTQDPFRSKLFRALSEKAKKTLYIQTNDFTNDSKGVFSDSLSRSVMMNAIRAFDPDYVISLNSAGLNAEVVSALKGVKITNWFIDHPSRIPNELLLPPLEGETQLFAASKVAADWLNKNLNPKAPAEIRFFCTDQEAITRPLPLEQRPLDVAFVGTLWSTQRMGQVLRHHKATPNQLKLAQELLEEHSKGYLFDLFPRFQAIFPRARLSSSDVFALFDDHISSINRLRTIQALGEFKIRVHGSQEWWDHLGLRNPVLTRAFDPEAIFDHRKLMALYSQTKAGLNISHHQTSLGGMPIRIFDLFAAGCPVFTNTAFEEESGFIKDRHFFVFEQPEELADKLRSFLSRPDEALATIAEAQQILRERHTFEARARELIPGGDKQTEHQRFFLSWKDFRDSVFPCTRFETLRKPQWRPSFSPCTLNMRSPVEILAGLYTLVKLVLRKPRGANGRMGAIQKMREFLNE